MLEGTLNGTGVNRMDKRKFLKDAGAASVAAGFAFASRSAQAQIPPADVRVLVVYHSVTGNTEKMANGVAEGAKTVPGTDVNLKKVADVTADDLLTSDALIVGSPVYYANMSGDIKSFFDGWLTKFKFGFADFKMRNKVGAAFVTGASVSNGKESTMQSIHAVMLINQMIVVSGGGAFGASATTGPESPGIDEKKLDSARALGKRAAEVAAIAKRGSKT
jgi:NAD(P)H dehydrogenase (quinone)